MFLSSDRKVRGCSDGLTFIRLSTLPRVGWSMEMMVSCRVIFALWGHRRMNPVQMNGK